MAYKLLALRRDDECAACTAPTPQGTRAWWDNDRKHVICTRCRPVEFTPLDLAPLALAPIERVTATAAASTVSDRQDVRTLPPPRPVEVGVAGYSAGQQFERRLANHQARDTNALRGEAPGHVRAWDKGATGERHLGQFLDDALDGIAVVLHDRQVPGTRGNIDHLVIASSGIWVIDAKNWSGTVDVRTHGIWKFKHSELFVDKRKRTKAIEGMGWQCDAVRGLTEPMGMGAVPIHPVVCFVDSEWARHANAEVVDGVLVVSPDKLRSVVSQPGWVTPDAINAIATQLSAGLPATARR